MEYQDFDLLIQADGLAPIARANDGREGVSTTLPAEIPESTGDPQQTGETLFRWLFRDEILVAFKQAKAEAHRAQKGLRIRLNIDLKSQAAASIHALSWELLYDSGVGRFLARDPATPLVRTLTGQAVAYAVSRPTPLRILLAAANPANHFQLGLEDELSRIQKVIPQAEVVTSDHTTRDGLQRLLNDPRGFHVVHIMGHGAHRDTSAPIALERQDRNADILDPNQFIQLFPSNNYPRLLVLNFCWSGAASSRNVHFNCASRLAIAGVPAVLGFTSKINDKKAIKFSESLYKSFAENRSIEEALAIGRTTMEEAFEQPVLYMHRDAKSKLIDDSLPSRTAGAGDISTPMPPIKSGDIHQIFHVTTINTDVVGVKQGSK